jgi:hypothetical protein
VAVHGLNESLIETWTDPKTGVVWIRDLLPKTITVARVLSFGYDASASSFCGANCEDTIQKHAHTLVALLQADRNMEGCDHRPIVFLCHGLGGILVKKALIYSASRTSAQVAHLYTIFVSTYAILFFGTPHNGIYIGDWLALESIQNQRQSSGISSALKMGRESKSALDGDTKNLKMIIDQFAPLIKQFHIYFFWEEVQTDFGGRFGLVVEESSAAPILDNTERSGIDATHSMMVKFSRTDSSSYKTVIAALTRYCHDAPKVISHRWTEALVALARARSNEAFELAGLAFDVHNYRPYHYTTSVSETPHSRYFYPPQETVSDFVGREESFEILHKSLFQDDNDIPSPRQRRFVVYGMGGSGKTQFCSKFARDNQNR